MTDLSLFYYTLIILLISIFASALCFATFLVSRKKPMLYACLGFLFYFFDVALVFKDDYVFRSMSANLETVYFIGSPLLSVAAGVGIFVSLWRVACMVFEKEDVLLQITPAFLFASGSLLAYGVVPEGPARQFCFYSMRGVVLFGMLITMGVWYARKSAASREVLCRYRLLYALLALFGVLVVVENVVVMFFWDPSFVHQGVLQFFPERNFAENMLMVSCALFVFRSCHKTLSLHFNAPPQGKRTEVQLFIEDGLAAYKASYGLSNREAEVLRLILQGMDNQNIASEMSVTVGTVKNHVHSILKKCGQSNRRDLMKDFRMRS